jgi:hypothetical protein
MPIPNFDHNGVIPPHKGNPTTDRNDLSPYLTTTLELCQKFSFSAERRTILTGFLQLRDALVQIGITQGFQWIDGSFAEDCENLRGCPPNDIDIVTFYFAPSVYPLNHPIMPILGNRANTRNRFRVDHILVNLGFPPYTLVEETKYWFGIFTHRRMDNVWKGMLKVDLNTANDDADALAHVQSVSTP